MLTLCPFCTNVNHEISRNTESIHKAGSRVNFYGDNPHHHTKSVCASLQWTIIIVSIYFVTAAFYMATYAFVLPTNKATIMRFLLQLSSEAQSVTHFLQSWINNHHHAIIQSQLASKISIVWIFYFTWVLCLLPTKSWVSFAMAWSVIQSITLYWQSNQFCFPST
jgi:hypothetical protein